MITHLQLLHVSCNNHQTYHTKTDVDQMDVGNLHWSDGMQMALVSVTDKHSVSLQWSMKTFWLYYQQNLTFVHFSAITVTVSICNTQKSLYH